MKWICSTLRYLMIFAAASAFANNDIVTAEETETFASSQEREDAPAFLSQVATEEEAIVLQQAFREFAKKYEGQDLTSVVEDEDEEMVLPGSQFYAVKSSVSSKSVSRAALYIFQHPACIHSPRVVSGLGDYIALEDGSQWLAYFGDRYKTHDWWTSDGIVIFPNYSDFYPPAYQFKMVNQRTLASVQVNLIQPPDFYGPYTYWIYSIDYYNRIVTLNDGSYFVVDKLSQATLNRWKVNSTVILGVNDGYKSSSKPTIMINTATNDYVISNCK